MANCIPPYEPPLGDEGMCSSLTGNALFNYWCNHDCPSTYSTILNTRSDGSVGYNAAQLPRVQGDITQLFQAYLTTNVITDSTTDPRYSPFQNTILGLCQNLDLPGGCDAYLKSNLCKGLSRDQITNSPVLADFCGCYAPINTAYEKYAANPACDPLCHRASTVQRADPATGNFDICSNTVCVIDDVSITVNRSQTGSISFDQICGGCGGVGKDPCECIISGVDIQNILSELGVGTQFNQLCGSNSVCLQVGPNGVDTPVLCASVNPNNQPNPAFSTSLPPLLIGLGLLAFVILLLAALAARPSK